MTGWLLSRNSRISPEGLLRAREIQIKIDNSDVLSAFQSVLEAGE